MKKIKRLQDIKQEKMRLRIKQLELEKQMKQDWKLLKSGAKSSSAENKQKKETAEENAEDQSLWSAALNYGTTYISQKLAATAGHATEARVKQSMDNIVEKFRNMFGKKKKKR